MDSVLEGRTVGESKTVTPYTHVNFFFSLLMYLLIMQWLIKFIAEVT